MPSTNTQVAATANAANMTTFDKIYATLVQTKNIAEGAATETGKLPALVVTGATDELSRGVRDALTQTAYGIKDIGTIGLGEGIGGGLQTIGEDLGTGLGTGLANLGTGAGKGVSNFTIGLIPAALIGIGIILALGIAISTADVKVAI